MTGATTVPLPTHPAASVSADVVVTGQYIPPIDRIKIDRSFVGDLFGDSEHASLLIEAILSMARCLNLPVVAGGVETEEQAQFLRDRGCHELQGFLLSHPLPADELLPLLDAEKNEGSEAGLPPG